MTTEEAIQAVERMIYIEAKWPGTEETVEALDMAIAALRAQQEAEKNEPLTLEALREMDGEPVWINPAKEGGKIPARWMLVSDHSVEVDLYLFQPNSGIVQGYTGKSYGKTWIAFSRKPKEGTK